jgi:glutamate decarboxylase
MGAMQANAEQLASRLDGLGKFDLVARGEETLPLVAFKLAEEQPYDEFDIAFQLAAERGWMVPAYTMPPNADKVKMMRALVKLNLNRALVDTLADDVGQAIETLEKKGPASEAERQRIKTGTGY